ncbi:MAG: SDR family oxidoreductase [Pseudomonadota bacterium]
MNEALPRTALVTGASRGLGYATAFALGQAGWQVIALARTVGGLEDLADAIEAGGGLPPTLVPLSVGDDAGLQRLCLAIHERWAALDLAVNCAAHAPPLSPVQHIADKDFERSLEVNFTSVRRLVAYLHPLLTVRPDGRFVQVTDNRAGRSFYGTYGSTKAAADAFVRSWAEETRRLPPEVILFEPKPMPTALRARFFPTEDNSTLTPCADEAQRLIEALEIRVDA